MKDETPISTPRTDPEKLPVYWHVTGLVNGKRVCPICDAPTKGEGDG